MASLVVLVLLLLVATPVSAASRYWVGGGASTNWNATGNTNWSATSGGANNASVPGTADDVFCDANSIGTMVVSATITIRAFDCLGFVGTMTQNAAITVSGNGVTVRLVAGMIYGGTAKQWVFSGTSGTTLFYTGGQTIGNTTKNGAGTVQQQDAMLATGATLSVGAGTWDTGSYALSAGTLTRSGALTGTVNAGASTITLGSNTPFIGISTQLTFAAGTSRVVFNNSTATAKTVTWTGQTFSTLEFAATQTGVWSTVGGATFTNLIFSGGPKSFTPAAGTTHTITWTFTSTVGLLTLRSGTPGTPYTISAAAIALGIVNVADSTAAGAASRFQAVGGIDSGGNTNWDFPVRHTTLLARLLGREGRPWR